MSSLEASPLDLMQARLEALYTFDARGRMTGINSPFDHEVPRFHLCHTEAGNLWCHRAGVPDELATALGALSQREPTTTPGKAPPLYEADYIALLQNQKSITKAIAKIWQGPAYIIPPCGNTSGDVVEVTSGNADVLKKHMADWLVDIGPSSPILASLEGGHAVSLCASVRIGAKVHEAGIETLPSARRQGHAVRVATAWAGAVRDLGRLPVYSTSWANIASQEVAARLGARLIGTDFHITL